MKEKPIIFSTEMVKAILDGRKTQTRRVIKPQPVNCGIVFPQGLSRNFFFQDDYYNEPEHSVGEYRKCPYGFVGDRLWVRETWTGDVWCGYAYKADGTMLPIDCGEIEFTRWKPSIHMPRRVSRINLLVKNIRVERIQGISEEDAISEGCKDYVGIYYSSCRHNFINLWNSINEKRGYGWNVNPWVWVIEFSKI